MHINFYTFRLKLSEFPVVNDWRSGQIFIFVFFSLLCLNDEIVLSAKISTTSIIFRDLNRLSEDNFDLAEVASGDSCFSERFPCYGGLDVIFPLPLDQPLNFFHSVLELFFEVDGLNFNFRLLLRLLNDNTFFFSQLS